MKPNNNTDWLLWHGTWNTSRKDKISSLKFLHGGMDLPHSTRATARKKIFSRNMSINIALGCNADAIRHSFDSTKCLKSKLEIKILGKLVMKFNMDHGVAACNKTTLGDFGKSHTQQEPQDPWSRISLTVGHPDHSWRASKFFGIASAWIMCFWAGRRKPFGSLSTPHNAFTSPMLIHLFVGAACKFQRRSMHIEHHFTQNWFTKYKQYFCIKSKSHLPCGVGFGVNIINDLSGEGQVVGVISVGLSSRQNGKSHGNERKSLHLVILVSAHQSLKGKTLK